MTSESINDDTLPPDNSDILPPDTVLFGYQVLEHVGKGGWANVYKAKHKKLRMFVALKQLKPELVRDERKLQRFLHEADIIAQIRHPNVVTIHDLLYDKKTDLHYIVTELAEKGSLADRLKGFPTGLPVDQVLHLALGICSGLEAAHRKGVVHLDIKPSNVLLFDVGEERDIPKVIDFGIAKAPAIEGRDIQEGSSIYGSLHYMSPEQLDEDIDIDNRSDLYSLGITLYELLTGHLPFTGDTMKILLAHRYEPPKPPRELNSDIPEPLDRVVLKALQKDPKKRYQSAAGMHEALRAIVDASVRKEHWLKFQNLLERGQAYLRDGKWEEAIEVLGQADSLEPDSEQVQKGLRKAREQQKLKRLYNLGIESLEEEKWEEAQEHLTQVMDYDPGYTDGRAGEKLELATQGLERKQRRRSLMVHYRTGMGHFRKWEWTQAIGKLKQVVNQNPEFEDAADRLAEVQRYARAESLYEQAQRHIRRAKWEEAVELLEEVKSLSPPHRDVTEELQYAREKWEKLEEELEEEQQLDEQYDKGMAQLAAGDLEQAKVHFERIHQRQPDYRDVAERLEGIEEKLHLNQLLEQAYKHEAAGEWEQAANAYTEILNIDRFNREAIHCLERVRRRAKRKDHRIPQELNWRRSLTVASAIGVPCTLLIALLARDFFSLDLVRLVLLIASLLLIFVPLFTLIQWLIAQQVKTKDNQAEQ